MAQASCSVPCPPDLAPCTRRSLAPAFCVCVLIGSALSGMSRQTGPGPHPRGRGPSGAQRAHGGHLPLPGGQGLRGGSLHQVPKESRRPGGHGNRSRKHTRVRHEMRHGRQETEGPPGRGCAPRGQGSAGDWGSGCEWTAQVKAGSDGRQSWESRWGGREGGRSLECHTQGPIFLLQTAGAPPRRAGSGGR